MMLPTLALGKPEHHFVYSCAECLSIRSDSDLELNSRLVPVYRKTKKALLVIIP